MGWPMTRRTQSESLVRRTVNEIFGCPTLGLAIAGGSLMHALGHALLAWASGILARALAGGGSGLMDVRSTFLWPSGAGEPLLGLAIVGLFAAVAKSVGTTVALWAEARVAGEVGTALRLEVLNRVLSLHASRDARHADQGRERRGTSADLASLTTHVHDVERGVSRGVLGEARAFASLAPLAVLLLLLAPTLAASALVALVAFAALVLVTRRALRRAHARASTEAESLFTAAGEAVRHAELWASYGAEDRIRTHLRAVGASIVATSARLSARAALLSGTSEVLGALALVLTLALVSAGAVGDVDRGTLVPFAIVFFMAYRPLREVVEARIARARGEDALAFALSAAARDESGAEPYEVGPTAHVASAPRTWSLGDLVVHDLATKYGDHAPVSFRVPAGSIVAIVGPTGIGKTALLRVLLGLDAPRTGHVFYDGMPLDGAPIGPRGRPFAWVPQDAPILAATLVENVALGNDAKAQSDRALSAIGVADFAARVGESVLVTQRCLSGGERQWVSVARALATDLPVLVMDEPTSSLDPESERALLGAVARLRGRRTVLLVTHREAPLTIADAVVRLGSHRKHTEGGTRADLEVSCVKELAVDDISATILRERERRASGKGVDAVAE